MLLLCICLLLFYVFHVVCLVIVKHGWCLFMCSVGVRLRCIAYLNITKDLILSYRSTLSVVALYISTVTSGISSCMFSYCENKCSVLVLHFYSDTGVGRLKAFPREFLVSGSGRLGSRWRPQVRVLG